MTAGVVSGCQLSPRHSVVLVNRSLALRISGAEEGDLGLYFCIGHVNERLKVGKAFRLCGTWISTCEHLQAVN